MSTISKLALITLFFITIQALAIDETESLRQRTQDKDRFTSLSLDLSGKNGNSDTENIAFGLYHSERLGAHLGFVMATREYAKSNDVESANNLFAHARYNYYVSDTSALELFIQHNTDDFRSLESRELTGFGYRFELNKEQALGIGLFDEHERYLVNDLNEKYRQQRANFYWVYARKLNANSVLSNTLYFQPNINQVSDSRAFYKLSISAALTKNTYLRFGYLIEYDSKPVLNVEKTDSSFNAGFELEF